MACERVFIRHGAYHYDLGRDENGKRRSKMLCRLSDGEHAMYAALAEFLKPKAATIADLLTIYLAKGMLGLAPRTQSDYVSYAPKLKKHFGHMAPQDLKPTHVAQYLEKRKQGGAGALANKEIACLSSAFEYGQRAGLCDGNPCRHVRRNKVRPKTRYVRHEEFLEHFNLAPDYVQDIMAGIYLMELRPHEARDLRKVEAITLTGILLQESKTGKLKLIRWSDSLRFFITRATSRHPNSPFVFTNSEGAKWTEDAMQSAMKRLRERVAEERLKVGDERPVETFTWHDIRAKGESDHKEGGMGLLPLYKRAHVVAPVW